MCGSSSRACPVVLRRDGRVVARLRLRRRELLPHSVGVAAFARPRRLRGAFVVEALGRRASPSPALGREENREAGVEHLRAGRLLAGDRVELAHELPGRVARPCDWAEQDFACFSASASRFAARRSRSGRRRLRREPADAASSQPDHQHDGEAHGRILHGSDRVGCRRSGRRPTTKSALAAGAGSHQFQRPSRRIRAGTSRALITVASKMIPPRARSRTA